MLNQTVQNPLDGIDSVNAFGTGLASSVEYVPYSTKKRTDRKEILQKKSPVSLPEVRNRREISTFQGTKRAYRKSLQADSHIQFG